MSLDHEQYEDQAAVCEGIAQWFENVEWLQRSFSKNKELSLGQLNPASRSSPLESPYNEPYMHGVCRE